MRLDFWIASGVSDFDVACPISLVWPAPFRCPDTWSYLHPVIQTPRIALRPVVVTHCDPPPLLPIPRSGLKEGAFQDLSFGVFERSFSAAPPPAFERRALLRLLEYRAAAATAGMPILRKGPSRSVAKR